MRSASPLLVGLGLLQAAAFAQTEIIRDLHYPDLNADGSQVAFSYQGDLWVADLDGAGKGLARRLTVHEGYEGRVRYSPDGSTLAFSSDRDGNGDLYLVDIDGGPIERVTHHSAGDSLGDWSPDGKKLLFYAGRRDHRVTCPYEIELETGYVRPLLKDSTDHSAMAYSPDGRLIAGVRDGESWWRKGYRGSLNSNVFTFDLETGALRLLTDFDGSDVWPCFSADGTEVYYVSERAGRPNLFAQSLETGVVRQLTHHESDAVIFPSISGDGTQIVYEWNFSLWVVDVRGGEPRELEIRAPVDFTRTFEAEDALTSGIEEMEPNRDGSWVAIRLREDIFLVKPEFENGSVRVTDFPGTDGEYFWHPEGKRLVYISQRNRTGDIWQYDVDTKEKTCLLQDDRFHLHLFGFTNDAEKLLFRREAGGDGVFTFDLESKETAPFLTEPDVRDLRVSPDGKWVAAAIDHAKSGQDVYIRPLEGGEWLNVSQHPAGNDQPYWSPDGKKLFFVSRRSGAGDVYVIDLQRKPLEFDDYEAQMAKKEAESKPAETPPAPAEEEKPAEPAAEGQQPAEAPAEAPWPEWKPKPIEPMELDLAWIHERAERLTTDGAAEGIIDFTKDGKSLLFTRGGQIWSMDLDGKEPKQFVKGDFSLGNVRLTGDKIKLFFVSGGELYQADGVKGGDARKIGFKAEFDRDARMIQQWAFRQGWAMLDEGFYSHNFHGADWDAAYDHYAPFCTGTLIPEDFNHLMSRMLGELNASHLGCWGGPGRRGKATAELGFFVDPEHRGPGVRVADVMRWGPTDQPDATVQVGEYVLAIDGEAVSNNERMYELLADKAGERVKLLVNGVAEMEGAREISVKPISGGALWGMEYKRWIERNREMVDRLSGGRVYYAHIPGMDGPSYDAFNNELQGQAQVHDALIIDVRNNGGGNTDQQLMQLLERKSYGWWSGRGAPLRPAPLWFGRGFDGPMCVMVNQHSMSDAEIFPQAFQQRRLGKVIGTHSPGWVIFTGGRTLVNGHGFRVPGTGWYMMDGVDIENHGVTPDIPVDYPYEAYKEGRDPQIEAAVAEMLAELETHAPPERPDIPGHRLEVVP